MGLISKAVKGGIGAKVVSEARKPKNQQKAKSAFASLKSKFGGGDKAAPAKSGRKGSVKGTRKTTKPATRSR